MCDFSRSNGGESISFGILKVNLGDKNTDLVFIINIFMYIFSKILKIFFIKFYFVIYSKHKLIE